MSPYFMRLISRLLVASVFMLGLPMQPAGAGLVGTGQLLSVDHARQDRERIRAFLDREDVRAQLQSQGIDPEEAKARVNALTDDEVQKVAGRIDTLPAGGDIIGVLFTVFVILLVTDILGFTKVFSFTRSIRK